MYRETEESDEEESETETETENGRIESVHGYGIA